jgi:hypothetical protein
MPWKYSLTSAARKQRAAQTAQRERQLERERLEREWDAQDEVVYRGSAITVRAETLAAQMAVGSARLADVREMVGADFSAEPYADLSVLETQCQLMGIDPGTGDLLFAAVALYREGRRAAGATADGALAHALVLPTSLYLWMQDTGFRNEFGDD